MIRGLSSLQMQDESIQSLTECLCDSKTMPLLRDPLVKEVGLCYKALPHYKKFVKQREMRTDPIISAKDNVERALGEAGRLEQEAERAEKRAAEEEKKAAEKEEAAGNEDKEKHKREREEHKEKKEKYRSEKEKQKLTLHQIEREFPNQNKTFLKGCHQPIPIKNEHEFAHLYLEEIYSVLPD